MPRVCRRVIAMPSAEAYIRRCGAVLGALTTPRRVYMQLTLAGNDDVVKVRCPRQLTLTGISIGVDPLIALLGREAYSRRVILDLSATESSDSSGMAWVLGAHRRCKESGGRLVLLAPPPQVTELIRVLHVGSILHIAADEPAARALALT